MNKILCDDNIVFIYTNILGFGFDDTCI